MKKNRYKFYLTILFTAIIIEFIFCYLIKSKSAFVGLVCGSTLYVVFRLLQRVTDKVLLKKFGTNIYIRNGVGYGFISDGELYHNRYIEIGIGRVVSGRGDWGGGFEYSSTSPIILTIDDKYKIIKKKTDSFYNSRSSQEVEKKASTFLNGLGTHFTITNAELKKCVDGIFSVLPCKHHICLDVDLNDTATVDRMLKYFIEET